MADKTKDTAVQAEKAIQQSNKKDKKLSINKIVFSILTLLTALVVIIAVFGGVAYYFIHNNVNGIGEKSREVLQPIPALRWMLPSVPDPEDPKYLADDEIRKKYVEIKDARDDFKKKLDEANIKTQELQKYKDNEESARADIEAKINDVEKQQAQIDEQKKKLAEDKQAVGQMVASGDKAGFKEYFEKIDKESAQKIYAELLKEQKISEDAKKFSQLYEAMDPSSTAKIFEQMGDVKIDLIIEIMKNIKKETNAEILAAMQPAFASKITEKMSQIYLTVNK